MPNKCQQTVNLKEELERQKEEARADIRRSAGEEKKTVPKPKPKKEAAPMRKKFIKRSKEIDKVYNGEAEKEFTQKELHKITKPAATNMKELLYRRLSFAFGAIILFIVVYFLFFAGNKTDEIVNDAKESIWYAVILTNGDIYYGQVDDRTTDPIVVKNVYYDYDQINKNVTEEEKNSGNLKLVKQGSAGETYDPDNNLELVRTHVQEFKKLKDDSKVLKAILENEEKYN